MLGYPPTTTHSAQKHSLYLHKVCYCVFLWCIVGKHGYKGEKWWSKRG